MFSLVAVVALLGIVALPACGGGHDDPSDADTARDADDEHLFDAEPDSTSPDPDADEYLDGGEDLDADEREDADGETDKEIDVDVESELDLDGDTDVDHDPEIVADQDPDIDEDPDPDADPDVEDEGSDGSECAEPTVALVAPPDGGEVDAADAVLAVRVDGDGPLTVELRGRPVDPDFTIVVLPDTQFYSSDYPETFVGQTLWIREHAAEYDVRAVLHVGDIVDDPLSEEQWLVADRAMAELEVSTPDFPEGIPYGIAIGNHDEYGGSAESFNTVFGEGRFLGRGWYGGHHGGSNDNHYVLFEAGSTRFVAVFLEWSISEDEPVLEWARDVLLAHPDRRAIVTRHALIGRGDPASWTSDGLDTYEALRDVPTLDLMFCGHLYGEGRRTDTFEDHPITTLLADYQSREEGGNGWLRLLTFSPARGSIHVRTWSTLLDEWETDDDSDFELPYELPAPPFELITRRSGVPPGTEVRAAWPGLEPGRTYQWYAVASSCGAERPSDQWTFSTL